MNLDIENLVRDAKLGQETAKTELVLRFRPFVIKKAREVYIKNYDMDDLIQIGNLSIIKAMENYNLDKGNFVSYVTYAINNNFNYEIRKRGKERFEGSLDKATEDNVSLGSLMCSDTNIEKDLMKKEVLEALNNALMELNQEEKELIINIYFNKITVKEYAEIRDIKYGTALKRKNTILNKLKEKLKKF